MSYPGTRGEFPCWTPGRHKRGIPLLDAETTKQVPRLSLGVIPRHQREMPLLDARAAPEGNKQLHIIMWHLTWFLLFFTAWQSPARLRNKPMPFVEHFLSSILSFIKSRFSRQSTVLARNSNQDSEGGRRRKDGYLLLGQRCCLNLLAKKSLKLSPLQEMIRSQ